MNSPATDQQRLSAVVASGRQASYALGCAADQIPFAGPLMNGSAPVADSVDLTRSVYQNFHNSGQIASESLELFGMASFVYGGIKGSIELNSCLSHLPN
jgi:hypothetical protein